MRKVQTNPVPRSQGGFTLVELLVVVGIIVALATVSIVAVSQFSGKGETGARAAELGTIQSAMDTMIADKGITAVTATGTGAGTGIKDFATVPTEGPLGTYLRDNATTYYYCWTGTGKVSQLAGTLTACA